MMVEPPMLNHVNLLAAGRPAYGLGEAASLGMVEIWEHSKKNLISHSIPLFSFLF